jgi:hypothetical protein
MNIEIYTTKDEIIYKAINIGSLSEKDLNEMLYIKEEDHFVRKYQISKIMFHHNTNEMQKRYNYFFNREL